MAIEKKNNPPGPFAPYDNAVNEDDTFMRRVQTRRMDIGARASGMPGNLGAGPGEIVHVGTSVKGNRQG
jgi:hypothetical protein